jgi:predicted Zn-dependent peptidase
MPIDRTEYTSGLRVVTERMPGVRSVSLGVWVLAGSRDEAPRISGSSHFLEHLLFKGTKTRSAQDIAEAFDAVGGDLNAFTAKEYTCYYARVLDRDLELAVDHLADMLQHSVIRSADLDGERQVILEEINMHEDSPEDLVHDVFTETLWPDHPLGRPVLGTIGTINAATRDSVHRFYKRHYVPGNFVVAVAGNARHEDGRCRMARSPHGTSGRAVTLRSRRGRAWSGDARRSKRTSASERTGSPAPIRTGSRS